LDAGGPTKGQFGGELPPEWVHVADPTGVAALAPPPVFRTDEQLLDLTRLTGPGREVLIAINAGPDPLSSKVSCDDDVTLVGRWRDEVLQGEAVTVELPPYGVQVWEVQR
jgi:hypothetical protein